jgi:hypothetical protein
MAIAFVLVMPVYLAGAHLGWSPTIERWWSLFVIVLATVVSGLLSEREEKARKNAGDSRSRRARE